MKPKAKSRKASKPRFIVDRCGISTAWYSNELALQAALARMQDAHADFVAIVSNFDGSYTLVSRR